VVVTRDSGVQVTVTLTGNATNHSDIDDVSNLTVSFSDAAFVASVAASVSNAVKNDLAIDFFDLDTNSDADCLPDWLEYQIGSDPADANSPTIDGGNDSDGDGICNAMEDYFIGLGVADVGSSTDSDADGIPDVLELEMGFDPQNANNPILDGAGDSDGDGVSNGVEAYLESVNIPNVDINSDFDRDGIPDAREVTLGGIPFVADEADSDGDGVSDIMEFWLADLGVSDAGPSTDSDGDGLVDWLEVAMSSDPLDADAPTVSGSGDSDSDGISNALEAYLAARGGAADTTTATDSDGDDITDIVELAAGSSPFAHSQPIVWIVPEQNGKAVQKVSQALDQAVVNAVIGNVTTPLPQFDWSNTDVNILAAVTTGGTNSKTLTFNPRLVSEGVYRLELQAWRTIGSVTTATTIVSRLLRISADTNMQGMQDIDGDGVVDSRDQITAQGTLAATLQGQSDNSLEFLLVTDPGHFLRVGTTALAADQDSAGISLDNIISFGSDQGGAVTNAADGLSHQTGIFDFEVANLTNIGAQARIVLPLRQALPAAAVYRKFSPAKGWVDFVVDADNLLASAPGTLGQCPAPGDGAYQPGLVEGNYCVQLTIKDGGPNDADGLNGMIKDPGGIVTENETEVVTTGTRGSGVMSILLLLMLLGLLTLRSKKHANA
jgi:hypothetical protein